MNTKNTIVVATYTALVLGTLFVGLGAFAQDLAASAAAPDAATAGATVLPDIQSITGAASAGKWVLALVLALSLSIRFFRGPVLNLLPADNPFKIWCKGTLGGWVVNFVGSEVAALATALMAGPPTVPNIVSALLGGVLVTFGASGMHEFTKDTGLASAAPAVPAVPAPAPVVDPAKAADVLSLPPKP